MQRNEPIRMCIACRVRGLQKELIRLQQSKDNIYPYSGRGRSFYLCRICSKNEKKVKGLIKRFRLSNNDSERFVKYLKELDKNG